MLIELNSPNISQDYREYCILYNFNLFHKKNKIIIIYIIKLILRIMDKKNIYVIFIIFYKQFYLRRDGKYNNKLNAEIISVVIIMFE